MKQTKAQQQTQAIRKKRQKTRDKMNKLFEENLDFPASDFMYAQDMNDGIDAIIERADEYIREHCEIIYYSRAIEYLQEHDQSLRRSIEIASEYGYPTEKINSELLASLLNIEDTLTELYGIQNEIEEILEEREEINEEDK